MHGDDSWRSEIEATRGSLTKAADSLVKALFQVTDALAEWGKRKQESA